MVVAILNDDGTLTPMLSTPIPVKIVQDFEHNIDTPLVIRIDSWDDFKSGRVVNNQPTQTYPIFPETVSIKAAALRADPANTDTIWIGDQSVSVQNGFPLFKTDPPVIIPVSKGKGRPHMISPTANQLLYWCGVVG